jgi:phenylalanyl-tRNA synthetase beta chain
MGACDVRLFELRHTFAMREGGFAEILEGRNGRPLDRSPTIERRTACGVLVGRRSPSGWSTAEERVDLFDVRGCVDRLQAVLGWSGWSWTRDDLPAFLDPREAAVLTGAGGRGTAGWMGRIAVPVLRAFDLDQVVYAFELDIDTLASKRPIVPQFVPFSRFPMVERDLAFVVPDDLPAARVIDAAERVARKGMKDAFLGVEVFDVYRGKGVQGGHRSLALRFRFRAPDRTLEDRAVDGTMTQVQRRLAGQLGIELRA